MVLLPAEEKGIYRPTHLKGYSEKDASAIQAQLVKIPSAFTDERRSLLVNSLAERSEITEAIGAQLQTKYYILCPVIAHNKTIGYLFAGRKVEALPLASSRLLVHDQHAMEAIAGVIAAIQNQFDQFKMLEAERTRIAREMHDEIGSELTKIKMFSQLLLKENVSETQSVRLKKISDTSLTVLQNVSEIIWTMNSWNDTLGNLAAYIRRYTADYCETNDLNCLIRFPEDLPEVFVSSNYRRNIFLIIKEALHNIVKHANATQIDIHMQYTDAVLWISVEDNGTGIKQQRSAGSGCLSMKHRAEEMNGKFNLGPGKEGGTTLSCSLPLPYYVA
jgi:signal transduction histidine kinase